MLINHSMRFQSGDTKQSTLLYTVSFNLFLTSHLFGTLHISSGKVARCAAVYAHQASMHPLVNTQLQSGEKTNSRS